MTSGTSHSSGPSSQSVRIPARSAVLEGDLTLPGGTGAVVLFAHGSGSSRHSPRNQFVARSIQASGLGTLLFDLLTAEEEALDLHTRHLRFDIALLAERLVEATRWIHQEFSARELVIGYFGASTGGGAALVAAAHLGAEIGAVVSRGGRPDLAGESLPLVAAPTLLIVGAFDSQVIELNRQAYARLVCRKQMILVPGASHLFEEPGTLETVARVACEWFTQHLQPDARAGG